MIKNEVENLLKGELLTGEFNYRLGGIEDIYQILKTTEIYLAGRISKAIRSEDYHVQNLFSSLELSAEAKPAENEKSRKEKFVQFYNTLHGTTSVLGNFITNIKKIQEAEELNETQPKGLKQVNNFKKTLAANLNQMEEIDSRVAEAIKTFNKDYPEIAAANYRNCENLKLATKTLGFQRNLEGGRYKLQNKDPKIDAFQKISNFKDELNLHEFVKHAEVMVAV